MKQLKGTWKRTNENKRKTIQQPNKKRKDKHERTKWTRIYCNHKSRQKWCHSYCGCKRLYYIKEAERQLNTKNYRKLQEDPTGINMKLVHDTIVRFKKQKLINQKVVQLLTRNDPKTP